MTARPELAGPTPVALIFPKATPTVPGADATIAKDDTHRDD